MRRRTVWLVTLTLVAWPAIVGADPITLIGVTRSVSAFVGVRDDSGFESGDDQTTANEDTVTAAATVSAPQGHFASAVGTLSSSSASDLRHFSGVITGTSVAMVPSSSELPRSHGVADSLAGFSVAFQLDTPHEVDLSVHSTGTELLQGGLPFPIFSIVDARFQVVAIESPVFRTIFSGRGFGEFHKKALLPPGGYIAAVDILVDANSTRPGTTLRAHGESFYTIDLSPPAPTPEPTSIALLGSGLLGLMAGRRRRSAG
jgi:hypothetical protein